MCNRFLQSSIRLFVDGPITSELPSPKKSLAVLTIRGFWMVIIELWSYFRWQKTQYMCRKGASLAETPDSVGSREHQKPDINLLTAKILAHLHLLPLKIYITSSLLREW